MSNWQFDRRSSADDVVHGQDLRGRRMIVTGANTGIGYEAARALASAGAHVVLACRNPESGQRAAERIVAQHPDADVQAAILDLGSFESIRSFCEGQADASLDVLVCNAGLIAMGFEETDSGFEQTVGVCHVGHFLLTQLLLPSLLAGDEGRVVMVSSESHRSPRKLDFDRLPLTRANFNILVAYGQAKLCNVLMANELDRRYAAEGLRACSVHPGNLVTTDIGRGSAVSRIFMKLVSPFTKNASQGAATTVVCATHPTASELGGVYFSHCQPKRSSREANDPAVAKRLWEISEEWLRAAT